MKTSPRDRLTPGLLLAALFFLALIPAAFAQPNASGPAVRWFKGNTHTHTLNSDGDSLPYDVVKWYRENGYNFVFLTDHEFINDITFLNSLVGKKGMFEVFSGQEVTGSFEKRPHHVNGLGISTVVLPEKAGSTSSATLQKQVDGIRSAGGLPQLNHPNFGWALTPADIRGVRGLVMFEVYNGHPLVNNLGGGGSGSTEEIWDALLTSGFLIYGAATDDSHYFRRIGDPKAPVPGKGWIAVRAAELSQKSILEAIERGDFYASTGVELEDYSAGATAITIKVKTEPSSRYRVVFIGEGGRILQETSENPAVYRITGTEKYIRAKIVESNGKLAWTQPVFPARK